MEILYFIQFSHLEMYGYFMFYLSKYFLFKKLLISFFSLYVWRNVLGKNKFKAKNSTSITK